MMSPDFVTGKPIGNSRHIDSGLAMSVLERPCIVTCNLTVVPQSGSLA